MFTHTHKHLPCITVSCVQVHVCWWWKWGRPGNEAITLLVWALFPALYHCPVFSMQKRRSIEGLRDLAITIGRHKEGVAQWRISRSSYNIKECETVTFERQLHCSSLFGRLKVINTKSVNYRHCPISVYLQTSRTWHSPQAYFCIHTAAIKNWRWKQPRNKAKFDAHTSYIRQYTLTSHTFNFQQWHDVEMNTSS